MNTRLRNALAFAGLALAAPAFAQVSFFEHEGFEGRSFTTERPIGNFARHGFNDRASSAVVRGHRWEVCNDAGFQGRCVILRPGQYPSLSAMGLNDRVSSVRGIGRHAQIDDERYAPPPMVDRDYRRHGYERLYQATVTSVRAVVATPERRCWIEPGEVVSPARANSNVPGAMVGAVLGGILGHQIGSGRTRDVATVGGVVAGAAVGSSVGGRGSSPAVYGQDVERCADAPSQPPHHWDVSYVFRGREHRAQLLAPPGATITVNREGEPRG